MSSSKNIFTGVNELKINWRKRHLHKRQKYTESVISEKRLNKKKLLGNIGCEKLSSKVIDRVCEDLLISLSWFGAAFPFYEHVAAARDVFLRAIAQSSLSAGEKIFPVEAFLQDASMTFLILGKRTQKTSLSDLSLQTVSRNVKQLEWNRRQTQRETISIFTLELPTWIIRRLLQFPFRFSEHSPRHWTLQKKTFCLNHDESDRKGRKAIMRQFEEDKLRLTHKTFLALSRLLVVLFRQRQLHLKSI